MEQKTIKIADLEVNRGQIDGLPKNPRTIKDARFEALKKSIEDAPEMLALRELLVYPHNGKFVVIGGNMRLRACKDLGYKELPCKVIDESTPVEKLREYTIKDNIGFGADDWGALFEDWNTEELADWGLEIPTEWGESETEEKEVTEDDFDEENEEIETRCKKGDIWQLGNNRLMCGDSTSEKDVQTLMQGELADLWLTDPPYNVDYQGGTADALKILNDNMASAEFLKFLTEAFKATEAVMANGCPFYVWFASREHINFEKALNNAGLQVRQELIWNKNSLIIGRQDYQWKHEPCLYGWKEGAAHYFITLRNETTVIVDEAEIDPKKMKKDELVQLCTQLLEARQKMETSVLYEAKPSKNDLHPTMKPVRLFGRLVRNSSKQGDLVLDLFGGSGSTLIACEQLNRKCFMMELDEHYCDVIIARWEKLTGKTAVKINE